jgi:DNA polymerase
MRELHLDYETKSKIDLKKCGADAYSRDASTSVLSCAYKFSDGDFVKLWEPHLGPMPAELREALTDPQVRKIAFNAAFEIAITRNVLKIRVDVRQWRCVAVMALSLGLPSKLEVLVRDALKLSREYWKDAEGDRLIRLFCFPSARATWESHPVDWAKFMIYNRRDVVAEEKAYKVMSRYVENIDALFVWWTLDMKINDTGLPVDYDFIKSAKALAATAKAKYSEIMKRMTGLANPNSRNQLLPWLQARGYPISSLGKDKAKLALREDDGKIDDEAKTVLELRFDSNKTSLAKFDAIERASWGGRLRGTFQFMGAGATGRWAGRILGQNMPRPWKGVEEFLAQARKLIAENDMESIEFFFDKVLDVIISSIRSAISAPVGKKFVVADLASIELVVIAWLTGCKFWLDVVRSGKDAYKAFAEQWLGISYDEVTKAQRNMSKPPALGCGYRMGAGREVVNSKGDLEKTGLWGYGAGMGVDLTKEECKAAVKVYRNLSPEIKQSWYDLENAAIECVTTHEPQRVGKLMFDLKPPFLRLRLPSGRYLHYCRPRIEAMTIEFEDEETGEVVVSKKIGVSYERVSQTSGKWVRRGNHGGRFIEQAVQGIARDLLAEGLRNADDEGFEVVGHYHDEILTLVDYDDSERTVEKLVECMTRLPRWATDMPCRAEGYEDSFYHK